MTIKFGTACTAAALAATLALGSYSASAQEASVSAADPEAMVTALKFAGYKAELITDNTGDPLIETSFGSWNGKIVFYGCDAETKDDCDSVMLTTGFDREKPTPPELVNQIVSRKRFASVRLDDEGDPFVEWDIVMSDPIPTGVFLRSVQLYSASLDDIADMIFAEER
jgi:hypothetical protein